AIERRRPGPAPQARPRQERIAEPEPVPRGFPRWHRVCPPRISACCARDQEWAGGLEETLNRRETSGRDGPQAHTPAGVVRFSMQGGERPDRAVAAGCKDRAG